MRYDDWKQRTPDEDDLEDECLHCGTPCNGTYCSEGCKWADLE